jgi:hypothetical protein
VFFWHSAKKLLSLPSVFYLTLGKAFFAECRGFAECFLFGSRQSLRRSAKKRIPTPSHGGDGGFSPSLGGREQWRLLYVGQAQREEYVARAHLGEAGDGSQ